MDVKEIALEIARRDFPACDVHAVVSAIEESIESYKAELLKEVGEPVLYAEFAEDGGWLGDASEYQDHLEEPHALYTSAQLAAEQLNNKLLRDALEFLNARIVTMDLGGVVERAISLPASTEALDKYVAEKVKEAVKEADDQILAAKNLLAIMHRDGGHHEFAVGLDQAIQDAMAVYYELTRQRDLAIGALGKLRGMAPADDALQAIKESEAQQCR